MEIIRAKELLEALADGVDPLTGEVLPASDSCNQPDIIRALHLAVAELERASKRMKSLPENAGKPWTPESDKKLLGMFDEGSSKRELCAYFKRTEGAIESRLVRLGRIEK